MEELFDFIEKNKNSDTLALRLSLKKTNGSFDPDFAILQIESRKKYADKLNELLTNRHFLFPDPLSAEQASHQSVAKYHSSLIKTSDEVLDMTAGLGVDAFYLARKAKKVTAIELDPAKADILKRNILSSKTENLEVVNEDSISFLKQSKKIYDLIFIDPSRRNSSKQRVFNLRDSSPDVISNLDILISHSKRLIIKASPLLDITQTIKDLPGVVSIKAVGVKGECKELLIEISAANHSVTDIPPILEAVNLDSQGNVLSYFSDFFNGNINEKVEYANMDDLNNTGYILEPSAMMMKIQSWEKICSLYKAKKFAKSSHLFLTPYKPDNFPGRVSRFIKIIKKNDLKSQLKGLEATVISKNHPLSSDDLRTRFKIKEGDKYCIYATRLGDKPIFLLSER